MIMLDVVVYQMAADGSTNVMIDNETIPFGTITHLMEYKHYKSILFSNLKKNSKKSSIVK